MFLCKCFVLLHSLCIDCQISFPCFSQLLFRQYGNHIAFSPPFFGRKITGSKPKTKPKKERTEEEKKFRRRAKYFLAAQFISVLVFLSLFGGSDTADVEFEEEDDGIDYNE